MKDRFKTFNSGRANFFLVAFIALVLAGGVLKITAPVILPFTIALLLTFVMKPLVTGLERFHVPAILAILLIICLIIAGLCLMGAVLFSSGRTILALYPKYERRLSEIYSWIATIYDFSYDEHLSFFDNIWGELGIRMKIRTIAFSLSNSFVFFLRDAVMVVLFVVFLLIESTYFNLKIDVAFEDKDRAGQIKKIGADIISQVARYLSIKFFISLITGIVIAVSLGLTGLEFPLVWGIIQFILNFIPNIGSIVAGVGVGLVALLQFWPEPGPVIIVCMIMLVVNMVLGNVLDPKIMGDNLGLSPIVVLLSLVLWGWIWGFVGMILAVPMTVIIKIVAENIPVLEPLSILLGSRKSVKQRADRNPGGADSASS